MPHRPLEDDLFGREQDRRRQTRTYHGIECDDCGERFDTFDAFKDHLPDCPGP